jgi:hypothetical protein
VRGVPAASRRSPIDRPFTPRPVGPSGKTSDLERLQKTAKFCGFR